MAHITGLGHRQSSTFGDTDAPQLTSLALRGPKLPERVLFRVDGAVIVAGRDNRPAARNDRGVESERMPRPFGDFAGELFHINTGSILRNPDTGIRYHR